MNAQAKVPAMGRRQAALNAVNAKALAARRFLQPGYKFRPVSPNDAEFHALARQLPYFGMVEVSILGGETDFLMLSMNDDIVARVYLLFGPDAYETLSLAAWTRLARETGRRIVDVGAFAGLYTVAARSVNSNAKITAFEPISHTRARLQDNLNLNRLQSGVTIEPFAVSEHFGSTRINVTQGISNLDAGASLVQKTHRKTESGETVKVVSLDQYFSPGDNVGLIKIDVELHEGEVLAGARHLLRRCRPAVLCEVSKAQTLEPVYRIFTEADYRVFAVDDQRLRLLPVGLDVDISAGVFNVLALASDEQACIVFDALDSLRALYRM